MEDRGSRIDNNGSAIVTPSCIFDPPSSILYPQSSIFSPPSSTFSPPSSSLITDNFAEVTAALLRRGNSVRFRATGSSMYPTIREGEAITVEFVEPRDVQRGDILLYRSAKRVIAHRVVAILNPPSSILYPQSSIFPRSSILDSLSSILNPPSSFFSTQSSSLSPQQSAVSGQLSSRDPQSSILNLQSSHPSPHYSFILRGDASSSRDAPVESGQVLGKVVSVERNGRGIAVNSIIAKVTHYLLVSVLRLARRRGIKPIFHFIRRLPVPVVARSG